MSFLRCSVALAVVCLAAHPLSAQQAYLTTPLVGVSDSFYEHLGVNWGFRFGGPASPGFSRFGGPTSVVPAFGGFDPNSGARFGFGTSGSGGGFSLNFSAAQGSRRTITSSAPSVTVANGATGFIQSGTIRPFVTGLVPVVGARPLRPVLISPLRERLERLKYAGPAEDGSSDEPDLELGGRDGRPATAGQSRRPSSAERGDVSVAEIKRQQELAEQAAANELQVLVEQAAAAARAGRRGAARIRYQQAAKRATGALKQQLLEKLAALHEK